MEAVLEMTRPPSRRAVAAKRVAAVVAGAVLAIVLCTGTDKGLESLGVYPPLSQPTAFSTPLLLLATLYRQVYGVLGAYVTARLAPDRPMGHVLVLGALGFVANVLGTVAGWSYGAHWYPMLLAALAIPCAWLGGVLGRR